MNTQKAKELVCASGKRLLKEGLVARTWGNVSVKIDNDTMVITPSGRKYEELTPNDMVVVNFRNLKYEGRLKPSSELKLHAEIYTTRPQINAVIHTHQMYASIIASAQKDVPVLNPEHQEILGAKLIKGAPYALPNSKKITKETAKSMEGAYAALMSNHGAVCCGHDLEETFQKCLVLEEACQLYLEHAKQN